MTTAEVRVFKIKVVVPPGGGFVAAGDTPATGKGDALVVVFRDRSELDARYLTTAHGVEVHVASTADKVRIEADV